MMYGPFSLAGATAAEMRYRLWLNSGTDKLMALASVDGDEFYGISIKGNSGGWLEKVLDLSNVHTLGDLTGRPKVWVLFAFISDGSRSLPEGAYVDDILVRKFVPGVASAGPQPSEQVPAAAVPGLVQAPARWVIQR